MTTTLATLAALAFDRKDKAFTVYMFSEAPEIAVDCAGCFDFHTEADARAFFDNPWQVLDEGHRLGLSAVPSSYWSSDVTHITLEGPCTSETKRVSGIVRRRDICKESAMEAGMLHGVEAYNEAMGF